MKISQEGVIGKNGLKRLPMGTMMNNAYNVPTWKMTGVGGAGDAKAASSSIPPVRPGVVLRSQVEASFLSARLEV